MDAMESDKFCLRWNDFESNISTAFRELREDKDFFDVTLACEDDQIEAHKVILSACSPFFKSVLKRNKHQHPLLYLKGVKFADLVAVLNFMYHGEVNVAQEELNTFLGIAEELKVKGLTSNGPSKTNSIKPKEIPTSEDISPPQKKTKMFQPNPVSPVKPIVSIASDDDIQEVQVNPVKLEPIISTPSMDNMVISNPFAAGASGQGTSMVENNSIFADDFGEFENYDEGGEGFDHSILPEQMNADGNKDDILDSLVESLIVRRKHPVHGVVHECTVCNKVLKKKNKMKSHAEIHVKGFSHQCNFCGKHYKTRPSLKVHISITHKQEKDEANANAMNEHALAMNEHAHSILGLF